MSKVVVIGGGNGTAVCLQALKPYAGEFDISAIVAVADSGGPNGELSKKLGVLPSADILRAVLAMSPHDYKLLHKIFRGNRFANGEFKGHYLGNMFLMLTAKQGNDYISAIRALEDSVEAIGKAYPCTLEKADLCVELDDGTKVVSEADIDRPTYDRSKKITRAWLEPEVEICQEAKQAILAADYIILAQGSLYTSLIPNLLAKGMKQALNDSKAKLIRVLGSCLEIDGETGPESLSGAVAQLQNYLPREPDTFIYSTHEFSPSEKKRLEEKRWMQMEIDKDNIQVKNAIGFDFELQGGGTDPKKLGNFLKENIL